MAKLARGAGVIAVLCLCLAAPRTSRSLSLIHMSFPEIVKASDNIFTAVCESRASEFRGGNIVTTYQLRPVEIWKGSLPLKSDGTFEMEELGGSVSAHENKVRIGQVLGGMSAFVPGEETLLFTTNYVPNAATLAQTSGKGPIYKAGNQLVVGRTMGRFTVLTDSKTGEQYVSRLGLSESGLAANDLAVRAALNKQNRALRSRLKNQAAGSGKTSDDWTAAAKRQLQERSKLHGGSGALPEDVALEAQIQDFETLDSVRDRVKTLNAKQETE